MFNIQECQTSLSAIVTNVTKEINNTPVLYACVSIAKHGAFIPGSLVCIDYMCLYKTSFSPTNGWCMCMQMIKQTLINLKLPFPKY